jgi:ubiquinone/menaquinone biosynthesis C-methylase UbiE
MRLKDIILKLYYLPFVSIAVRNTRQAFVRTVEWEAVKPYIKGGKFLDVGCGAGYAMKLAKEQCGCDTYGIDPDPGAHGVGRNEGDFMNNLNISKGFSENLPFPSGSFDVVYSSHVLEHVSDTEKTLTEMNRVLKQDGVLVIGMPTATMAFINAVTQYLFTTHHRLVNWLFSGKINVGRGSLKRVFLPASHSHSGSSVFFDMRYYRITNWEKFLKEHFTVERRICPLLYSYPEYRQLFPPVRLNNYGSSVFFICRKK